MTSLYESMPADDDEVDTLVLASVCRELLELSIPDKLRKSVLAKLAIESAIKDIGLAAEIDNHKYVTKDYLTDKVSSYRLQFVPHEFRHKSRYFDKGELAQLVINAPLPFIADPLEPQGIELALVRFVIDDEDGQVTEQYIITPTGLAPYTDFAALDFFYEQISEISARSDILPDADKRILRVSNTDNELSIKQQREIAEKVYEIINLYALGRQSRTEDTMQ